MEKIYKCIFTTTNIILEETDIIQRPCTNSFYRSTFTVKKDSNDEKIWLFFADDSWIKICNIGNLDMIEKEYHILKRKDKLKRILNEKNY